MAVCLVFPVGGESTGTGQRKYAEGARLGVVDEMFNGMKLIPYTGKYRCLARNQATISTGSFIGIKERAS